MNTGCRFMAACLLIASAGCSSARIAGQNPLPAPDPQPMGSVWVDAGRREMIITGFVNQVAGPVEMFACGPAGKTHESVLVLMARPHDIQAGLLLLGAKHGPPMPDVGKGPPVGDTVRIKVTWSDNGIERSLPAEQLIKDVRTRKSVKHGAWVFNGSMTIDGRFKAMEEESYIATYWDPWGIINIGSDIGSDDERIVVNEDRVPPLHTPVTVTLFPEVKP